MPNKRNHRQRFANPIQLELSSVVPLREPAKLYGAFTEKDKAGHDQIAFRFANKKGGSAKPIETFGALSWSYIPNLMQPFGDATFTFVRGIDGTAPKRSAIAKVGVFLSFLRDFCIGSNADINSFSLIDLKTLHIKEYIVFLNAIKTDKGATLAIKTKLAEYSDNLPRRPSSNDRLAIFLAYFANDRNLRKYITDRASWLGDNSRFETLLCNSDYRSIKRVLPYVCATARTLIPFYLLIAIKTSFNRTKLDELQIDAIRESVLFPDSLTIASRYAIVSAKRRALRDQIRTYRFDDPDDELNPAALVRHVIELTNSIRAIAASGSENRLFIYPRKAATGSAYSDSFDRVRPPECTCGTFQSALDNFLQENDLPKIRIEQIRPTMGNLMDIITGGDIVQQKAIFNHASIRVTDTHYKSKDSRSRQREQIGELQNNRERYVRTNGNYDPRNLATSGSRRAVTLGFECSDPYGSPIAGQKHGRLCDAHGHCPPCPLASVNTSDPSAYAYLLRFDKSIEDSKPTMHDLRWLHVWQPIQERLHGHMAKFNDPLVLSDARKITLRPLPPVE